MSGVPMLARLNAELAHPWGAEPPTRSEYVPRWDVWTPPADEWVPGDPLHERQFRFHDLIETHPLPTDEVCRCCDAASWPEPLALFEQDLDLLDYVIGETVETWIADYHRHARKAAQR